MAVPVETLVRGYVAAVRRARHLAARSGALDRLDRNLERPGMRFLRSLFAVHDIDDMARLDLPWWTFGAIRRVHDFLAARGGRATAFEYGPGASTLWLARRCARVATVEHDPAWWPQLADRLARPGNVQAWLAPGRPAGKAPGGCRSGRAGWRHLDFSHYVATIRQAGGPFDLVVIDGRARTGCLAEALTHLKPDGLILFDNSNRRRYRRALRAAGPREAGPREAGLQVSRYRGFAPTVPWPSESALLARRPAPCAAG